MFDLALSMYLAVKAPKVQPVETYDTAPRIAALLLSAALMFGGSKAAKEKYDEVTGGESGRGRDINVNANASANVNLNGKSFDAESDVSIDVDPSQPQIVDDAVAQKIIDTVVRKQLTLTYMGKKRLPQNHRYIFECFDAKRFIAILPEIELALAPAVVDIGNHASNQVFVDVAILSKEERVKGLLPFPSNHNLVQGGQTVILGINGRGERIQYDLDDAPMALVGGTTGSGKTSFGLHSIIQSLALQGVEVIIAGGKKKDFLRFLHFPNVTWEPSDQVPIITKAWSEELDILKGQEVVNVTRKVLVIDEYADAIDDLRAEATKEARAMTDLKPKEQKDYINQVLADFDESLSHITRLGRGMQRNLFVATQRVAVRGAIDVNGLPATVRANLVATLAFQVSKESEGKMLLGNEWERAVKLPGLGSAIVHCNLINEKIQGYFVPDNPHVSATPNTPQPEDKPTVEVEIEAEVESVDNSPNPEVHQDSEVIIEVEKPEVIKDIFASELDGLPVTDEPNYKLMEALKYKDKLFEIFDNAKSLPLKGKSIIVSRLWGDDKPGKPTLRYLINHLISEGLLVGNYDDGVDAPDMT